MRTIKQFPKFIVLPKDLIQRHALCDLSTYHHSYISSIFDTALMMAGKDSFSNYDLDPLEPNDPNNVLAQNIANFIGKTTFNKCNITLVENDYFLELWYEKTN